MKQQAGLSFEQAPPFAVPLRFLLTAPGFLLAAGVLVSVMPAALPARGTAHALAVTHLVTLGFLAMVMLGALMQMLPVVAGATLPASRALARLTHATLMLGTLALVVGFLGGSPLAVAVAMGLLGTGFGAFLATTAFALRQAARSETVSGIRLALAALAITVALGLALAGVRTGAWAPVMLADLVTVHASFGLMGWVLLLVIGVAYQVVPMFQITPAYASWLRRWLLKSVAGSLVLLAGAIFILPATRGIVELVLAGGVVAFAGETLRLQRKRRRKVADVTLDYWRLGMASLLVAAAVWGAGQWFPVIARQEAYPLLLGVLFLGGFAVSVVTGMLYKIVPFLAWFHLQAQLQAKAGTIPTMKDMITARAMRWQFNLHLAACALLVAAIRWPVAAQVAGGVWALAALLLWINLFSAVRRFAACGGRFV